MNQNQSERCPKCVAFDAETKELLGKTFSQDELALLTMLLAASIKFQHMQAQKLRLARDIKAMACQRDIDFASTVCGKLLMGFEDKFRDALCKRIIKDHGVALRMRHASCPHEEKPEAPNAS
jgi:hypothetical protein